MVDTQILKNWKEKQKLSTIENNQAVQRMSDAQILSSDIADIRTLKQKVAVIENEKATRNGICRIKNNSCGDGCICVEDTTNSNAIAARKQHNVIVKHIKNKEQGSMNCAK